LLAPVFRIVTLTTGVAVKVAFPALLVPVVLYEIPEIHPELEFEELKILIEMDSPTAR
jgi:hypothetical protein